MNILLTNDDGIFAPGITALYRELSKIADVTVVAPADGRSGMSHSITFRTPLLTNKVDVEGLFTGFAVQGSPADCVKLAVMELVKEPIDLVVSGMNNGANVGINVYYSGTVAAAMEGAFLGLPAVSCSLARELPESAEKFEAGAEYCVRIIQQLMPIKAGAVYNINVPLLSSGKPRGVRVVPQSSTGFEEHYIEHKDKVGRLHYELAGDRHRFDENPTDLTSLEEGYITVTALTPDMTDHIRTDELRKIRWQNPE